MTERRPVWSAPLLIAPCAVALFGGSVAWALGHSPATAPHAASADVPAVPTVVTTTAPADPHAAEHARLAASVAHRRQQAAQLEKRLARLRHDLVLARRHAAASRAGGEGSGPPIGSGPLDSGSGRAGSSGSGGTGWGASSGTGGSGSAGGAPVPVANPAPPPVAPPPVHTTTGASGKP